MSAERYAADFITTFGVQPHDDFDPDLVEYGTVAGPDLRSVVEEARSLDPNGECYRVRREKWREISAGDGIFDWFQVSEIDPLTLMERER